MAATARGREDHLVWKRATVDGRQALYGVAGEGLPVLFLHGWPDSVLRFTRVLAGSADLTAVVPALPGYPFAAPTRPVGMSAADTAHLLAAAMTEWGFPRFVVSAGDVGCDVAEVLAAEYPERVAALHLTDIPYTQPQVFGDRFFDIQVAGGAVRRTLRRLGTTRGLRGRSALGCCLDRLRAAG